MNEDRSNLTDIDAHLLLSLEKAGRRNQFLVGRARRADGVRTVVQGPDRECAVCKAKTELGFAAVLGGDSERHYTAGICRWCHGCHGARPRSHSQVAGRVANLEAADLGGLVTRNSEDAQARPAA